MTAPRQSAYLVHSLFMVIQVKQAQSYLRQSIHLVEPISRATVGKTDYIPGIYLIFWKTFKNNSRLWEMAQFSGLHMASCGLIMLYLGDITRKSLTWHTTPSFNAPVERDTVNIQSMTTSVTRPCFTLPDLQDQDQDQDRFFGLRPVLS